MDRIYIDLVVKMCIANKNGDYSTSELFQVEAYYYGVERRRKLALQSNKARS